MPRPEAEQARWAFAAFIHAANATDVIIAPKLAGIIVPGGVSRPFRIPPPASALRLIGAFAGRGGLHGKSRKAA